MVDMGTLGIWSSGIRSVGATEATDAAAELEALGYGTLWFPAGAPDGLEERIRVLLGATTRLAVATGIVSIWTHPAPATAALFARVASEFPGRFLLGLGVSHGPIVERAGLDYRRPYSAMVAYLDELDAASTPVPSDDRIIAALGPRMLALARDRSLGSHQYLVTPEHTRLAREALGPDALLAPEQTVVVEDDPERARARARRWLATYLELPNYVDNLVRVGIDRAETENGGSDRLVDQAVAWGDVATIRERVDAQRAAGADHVCLQALPASPAELPREQWRQLAAALL